MIKLDCIQIIRMEGKIKMTNEKEEFSKHKEMEIKQPKSCAQKKVQEGFELVKDLINKNQQIEPNLWLVVMWSILVDEYYQSGMTYEKFTKVWKKIKHHYKPWFDQ